MENITDDQNLNALLEQSAAMHKHLCPRQVLGVRMGLYAAQSFEFPLPQADKRLIVFVEADGCFSDGVSVATGCTMGHRTMRLIDHGKVAATFVDSKTGKAVRIHPAPESRQLAAAALTEAKSRWHAQLGGYQLLTYEQLFVRREVTMNLDVAAIVGKAKERKNCAICQEEILNQREVVRDGQLLCQACAGERYWTEIK
jgi:formylmethanofuran dehydrogenase subunit E